MLFKILILILFLDFNSYYVDDSKLCVYYDVTSKDDMGFNTYDIHILLKKGKNEIFKVLSMRNTIDCFYMDELKIKKKNVIVFNDYSLSTSSSIYYYFDMVDLVLLKTPTLKETETPINKSLDIKKNELLISENDFNIDKNKIVSIKTVWKYSNNTQKNNNCIPKTYRLIAEF